MSRVLMPEELGRLGWEVQIVHVASAAVDQEDEEGDSVLVHCPVCGRPAFDRHGHLDDPAHVVFHSLQHGGRHGATSLSPDVPGATGDDHSAGRKALKCLSQFVGVVCMTSMPRGDEVILLRFLGEALRGVAPDSVCDELASASS